MTSTEIENLNAGVDALPDLLDRTNVFYMDWRESENIITNFPLTPDKMYASEHAEGRIYATSREARFESHLDFVRFFVVVGALMGAVVGAAVMGEAFGHIGGWPTLILGAAAAWFGVGYLATSAVLHKPIGKVTKIMAFAWTEARTVWEAANEENMVPGLLADLNHFRVEATSIAHTYDTLISPVDREQAETDFLAACGVIKVIEAEAMRRRGQLYATRRTAYFSGEVRAVN